MPRSKPAPDDQPIEPTPAPASEDGSELPQTVDELRGELDSLKAQLKAMRPEPEAETKTALELVTNDAPLDPESFAAEFELALATPEPIPDDLGGDLPDEDVVEDRAEEDSAETLAKYPELNDVIRAFDEKMGPPSDLEPDASTAEDLGAAVSDAEIAALVEATSQLAAEPEPEPAAVDPIAEAAREMVEVEGGTALSEAEIAALLAQTAPPEPVAAPPPTPVAPIATAPVTAELVSADEIKAMLGIVDPTDDSTPEPVATEPEPAAAEPQVEPAPAEAEVTEPEPVSVWEGEIPDFDAVDPSVVARVPGHLAASALALPVCVLDDKLHCLSVEPFDQPGLDAISKAVGLELVVHAGDVSKVVSELRCRYGGADEGAARVSQPPAEAPQGLVQRLFRRSA